MYFIVKIILRILTEHTVLFSLVCVFGSIINNTSFVSTNPPMWITNIPEKINIFALWYSKAVNQWLFPLLINLLITNLLLLSNQQPKTSQSHNLLSKITKNSSKSLRWKGRSQQVFYIFAEKWLKQLMDYQNSWHLLFNLFAALQHTNMLSLQQRFDVICSNHPQFISVYFSPLIHCENGFS